MKEKFRQWRKFSYFFASCLIIIGGFFVLWFRLNHESIWLDESFSWAVTNHSFMKIITYIGRDVHPPLYYLMLKAFCLFGGNSIFTIRLFSVIGVLSLAALGLGPIRRACGERTGFLYTALVLVTPICLSMAQDGRMYTWSAFFVTGTVLYAYLAATGPKQSDWVKLGIFTLGAAYIHYYALMAVSITNFILFVWLIFKERRRLRSFFIMVSVVLLSYLPWIPYLITQISKVNQDYWIPPITSKLIWSTLIYPFGDKFAFAPELFNLRPIAFWFASILILWGLWQTAFKKQPNPSPNLLATMVYGLTLLTAIVLSYLYRPILFERYTMAVIGLFIFCLAVGLSSLQKRSVFFGVGILIFVLSLTCSYQICHQRFNGPMYEAVSYLEPDLPPDAVFVHFDWHTLGTFCYYFPKYKHYLYETKSDESDHPFPSQVSYGSDLDSFLKGRKNIWLIIRLGVPGEDMATKLIAAKKLEVVGPSKTFMLPYSWYRFSVSRLAPYQPLKP